MCDNHLANREGIDQSDIECKWYQVLLKDDWVLVEIRRDKNPSEEIGHKASEWGPGILFALFADLHDMQGTVVNTYIRIGSKDK